MAAAGEAMTAAEPPVMLTPGIHASYGAGVAALEANHAARRVAQGQQASSPTRCTAALFETSAAAFLADAALGHEVFGAASVLVRCADLREVAAVIAGLEGQLTATIHMDNADSAAAASLLPLLQAKAGRVLANGWPTGVEVCPAMVHGGPFPATSDGRTTSVGTLAMARFVRPVCYQDIPDGSAAGCLAVRQSVEAAAHDRRREGGRLMIRSLIQFARDGQRGIGALDEGGNAFALNGAETTLQLAQQAIAAGSPLAALAEQRMGDALDLAAC